jgi:membrane associated rhomboid family serine protease
MIQRMSLLVFLASVIGLVGSMASVIIDLIVPTSNYAHFGASMASFALFGAAFLFMHNIVEYYDV